MSNKTKQNAGYLTLVAILGIALAIAIVGLSKKLADAKVKSIQQTIEQQFNEVKGE